MLKINLHNYEAFFLDYIEGNLSETDRREVEKFLALYPDKFDELQDFKNITVSNKSSIIFDKSILKRDLSDIKKINNSNFNEFCIAKLEGDLDEKAQEQYSAYLNEFPEKKKTEELYRKAFLKPDKSIKYPTKSKLKHFSKAVFTRRIIFAGTAAASIGLLFVLQNPFNQEPGQVSPIIVSENINTPKEEAKTLIQNKQIGNKPEEKVAVLPKTVNISSKPEGTPAKGPNKREPVLLKKISASKASLETGYVSANILTPGIGSENVNSETGTIGDSRLVTLKEYTFNEIKKAIPDEMQNISDRRLNLKDLAETGKKEIGGLLSKQVTIEKQIDKDGKIKSFELNSSLFSFYTTKVNK